MHGSVKGTEGKEESIDSVEFGSSADSCEQGTLGAIDDIPFAIEVTEFKF